MSDLLAQIATSLRDGFSFATRQRHQLESKLDHIMTTQQDVLNETAKIKADLAALQMVMVNTNASLQQALTDLASAIASGNSAQFDAIMTDLQVISSGVASVSATNTVMQNELTSAISAVPLPGASAGAGNG